jgi:hypothetical protein
MATRSIIAKRTEHGWEGRYHHWDGYPTGLGAGLIEHVHKYGAEFVIQKLIDEEPVGWSTVIERDLTKPPVWEGTGDPNGEAPLSYFARGEQPTPPMRHDDEQVSDAEYCYVIDRWLDRMFVLKRPYGDDRWHPIGDVGLSLEWNETWKALQVLDTVEVYAR